METLDFDKINVRTLIFWLENNIVANDVPSHLIYQSIKNFEDFMCELFALIVLGPIFFNVQESC